MRFADGWKIALLAATFAVTGCDDEEEEDRATTILGLSADATAGMAVFQSKGCNTESCHGADGVSGEAPDLTVQVPAASDEQILDSLLNGKGSMPAQASLLTDQEFADVLAYLNENFSG
jgi:mono/diheme cytochrome c family protein